MRNERITLGGYATYATLGEIRVAVAEAALCDNDNLAVRRKV
jgi:hypothetical protein